MSLIGGRRPRSIPISLADIPQRAFEIHRMRPDVQETFDLAKSKGRSGLYWWYFISGFREMWLDLQSPEDWKGPATAPVPHLLIHGPIAVTWLMRELWVRGAVLGRPFYRSWGFGRWGAAVQRHLGARREPLSAEEQSLLVSWYFCRGIHEYHLEGLVTEEQSRKLIAEVPAGKGTPLILTMVHALAPDLHNRFPAPSSEGWREWCAGHGQHRFPILGHSLINGQISLPHLRKTTIRQLHSVGVNLIGHAGMRSGIGEDLRMAARALETAGIPFVVRNIPPSSGATSEEPGIEQYLADSSPFDVNIFCMAGMETVTVLSQNRNLLDGKINVGFWPWELSRWPQLWSHAPKLMDEVWASTAFATSAYRASTLVPVRQVPMAVDVETSQGLGRLDLGLPANRFLFGYSFDGHSSFSRKNPEGSIKAFQLAFPLGNEPVGLVLKGLRVTHHPTWHRLERLTARDPRIILISASMPRGTLLDLYRAIDCFVSLHRSEGFGRNIAECMLLGKPVIVTDYSGNTDFTNEATAALVEASLKPISDGEYPFGAGQVWADPNINQAAEQMRRILLDEQWRTRIASAGRHFIKTRHSPAAVGKKFSKELERLRIRII